MCVCVCRGVFLIRCVSGRGAIVLLFVYEEGSGGVCVCRGRGVLRRCVSGGGGRCFAFCL